VLPYFLVEIPEVAPETDMVDPDIMAELEKVMGADAEEVWYCSFRVYVLFTSN